MVAARAYSSTRRAGAGRGRGRHDTAERRRVPGDGVHAMSRDTGFPRADAEHDFLRARRRQVLSRLANWLRREPDDVNIMLPFKEVVEALGYQGERRLGLGVIKLDSIVGSVDRGRDF